MQIMRSNVYFLIVTANCKQSHVYDTLDVNFVLATLIFQVTLAAMRFPVFSRRGGGGGIIHNLGCQMLQLKF